MLNKMVYWILTCMVLTALLSGSMTTSVFAATYSAIVSDVDQQTVKGLGGALPWPIPACGAPIQNYPLAAQAVVDMGVSVLRVYIHNQNNVFDSNGELVNTKLADMLISEVKWAADNGIPYHYSPGWNNLPSSCYSDGLMLEEYEQAQCNSIKNMLNYFDNNGAPMPLVVSLANEPNCPVGFMTMVPVVQFQRVFKMLRATLDNAGYSSMKLAYPEAGEPGYTNMYLGGSGWPDLGTDAALNSAIGSFSSHTYYSGGSDQGFVNGYDTYGDDRDLWMTEYCYISNIDAVPGKDYTTGMTERFISDMAFLKFNYWESWGIWILNSTPETDKICSGNGLTSMELPPLYYVFKKIFTHVPPGSKVRRVTTDATGFIDNNGSWMDMIAFINESQMVVVLVNHNSTAKIMDVKGLTGASAQVYQIATTEAYNNDMTLISSSAMSGGIISDVNLAANSVTVIITDGGSELPTCSITSPSYGAMFTAGDNITIDANASDSDGSVTNVEFYEGANKLGEDAAPPYSYTWNNVPVGSYRLMAKATDNEGNTTISAAVNIGVSGELPSPWSNQDVGNPGASGYAGYASDMFTIAGASDDIVSTFDNFHFVYQPLSGNGEIVARVASLENTDAWAKAGVMIRETLNGDSKHVMMAITPSNGTAFQYRAIKGDSSAHTPGSTVSAPYWVKLVRSGVTFTGFESSDGSNWTEVGSVSFSMKSAVYIGLVVTSHSDGAICKAEMDNVSIAGPAQIAVDESALPKGYTLLPAVPNPFNASTRLCYELLRASDITLSVYDLLGQKVITLFKGKVDAGAHSVIWHGQNSIGRDVSSGAYLARLEAADGVCTTKLLLLR